MTKKATWCSWYDEIQQGQCWSLTSCAKCEVTLHGIMGRASSVRHHKMPVIDDSDTSFFHMTTFLSIHHHLCLYQFSSKWRQEWEIYLPVDFWPLPGSAMTFQAGAQTCLITDSHLQPLSQVKAVLLEAKTRHHFKFHKLQTCGLEKSGKKGERKITYESFSPVWPPSFPLSASLLSFITHMSLQTVTKLVIW